MLNRVFVVAVVPVLLLALSACGDSKPSAENTKICKQAAKRYVTCTEETLGKGAADMVRSKKGGIEACAKSQRTVDWYKNKCLPTKNCKKFMDCTMELASQAP